jgi:hypothetical protein
MTREKALEAMDKLVAMGYAVKLYEADMQSHVHFVDGEMTSIQRQLEVTALSLDKVDLRALVQAADELELDVGWSPISGNALSFTDQPTEEEQRRQAVVGKPRRHPR